MHTHMLRSHLYVVHVVVSFVSVESVMMPQFSVARRKGIKLAMFPGCEGWYTHFTVSHRDTSYFWASVHSCMLKRVDRLLTSLKMN